MATLLIADPAAIRNICPKHGRATFTIGEITRLVGGAPRVIRLRSYPENVYEVLIVRHGGRASTRPENLIATGILRDADPTNDEVLRGNVFHGMQVAEPGAAEEYV